MGMFAQVYGWDLDKVDSLPAEQFEAYAGHLEKLLKG